MDYPLKKFKKVVILDTIIFYPEHRRLLEQLAEEVVEYPSSLPEGLERQYIEQPELFKNKKCYTQLATDNIPLQLLMNRVDGAEVIISCWTDIPDEILRLNPQLKLILFWTHEKEHRINVSLAHELGMTVMNVPDYGTDAVAEVVFAGLTKLWEKNHRVEKPVETARAWTHLILRDLFARYRQIETNEKNTRRGKFTHHFHKLGLAKFDFSEKDLAEMIPERLLEKKCIGLLNMPYAAEVATTLRAFGVHVEVYELGNSSMAEYYKFLIESEYIFFDSTRVPDHELKKASTIIPAKLVNIRELVPFHYMATGKIFGIVGLGRIGEKVAQLAGALGFRVVYYSAHRNEAAEKALGVEYVDLPTLAESSDVVSVHVPAHRAENLVSAEIIARLRPGSILINTADGNAIDQEALTRRMLANEVLAFLDVYPGLPRKDILGLPLADKTDWKLHDVLPNHVLAYRTGWKTQESIRVKTYKMLGQMVEYLCE